MIDLCGFFNPIHVASVDVNLPFKPGEHDICYTGWINIPFVGL